MSRRPQIIETFCSCNMLIHSLCYLHWEKEMLTKSKYMTDLMSILVYSFTHWSIFTIISNLLTMCGKCSRFVHEVQKKDQFECLFARSTIWNFLLPSYCRKPNKHCAFFLFGIHDVKTLCETLLVQSKGDPFKERRQLFALWTFLDL